MDWLLHHYRIITTYSPALLRLLPITSISLPHITSITTYYFHICCCITTLLLPLMLITSISLPLITSITTHYFHVYCYLSVVMDRLLHHYYLITTYIIYFFWPAFFTFWPQTAFFGQTPSLFGQLRRSVFRLSLRVSASEFWRTVLCFSAAITHWHARDQFRNQMLNLGLTGRRVSPEIRACHQSRDRFSFKIRPASRFVAKKQRIK